MLGAGSLNFGGVTGNTVSGTIYDASLLSLDAGAGQGGAALTAGSLNIAAGGALILGNATLSVHDTLNAGGIVNNAGSISLIGSASKQALLNVSGASGFGSVGVLTGAVSLAGDSAIKFANGRLQTIDSLGALTLNGANAFVEIASNLGANSALTGLTNIAGALSLESGATIAPTGPLYVGGALNIDDVNGAGGTTVTLPTLNNEGVLTIGNVGMMTATHVNVGVLRSSGAITLAGGASAQACSMSRRVRRVSTG